MKYQRARNADERLEKARLVIMMVATSQHIAVNELHCHLIMSHTAKTLNRRGQNEEANDADGWVNINNSQWPAFRDANKMFSYRVNIKDSSEEAKHDASL